MKDKQIEPILYRLPELMKANSSFPVYITEGEKHADRLAEMGFVATTAAMGAGKWKDAYNETLRGRHCVILPDNDDTGRDHAEKVASSLNGVAASVKVLELPDLPPKGDIIEWLKAGGTAEELKRLTAECSVWTYKPTVIDIDEPLKPLKRDLDPAYTFPLEALGVILGGATAVIHEATQAPMALCGNSILAAAALAVQPHAIIEIDGRKIPLSDYFITIGQSGERKSAVDNYALHQHRTIQKERMAAYKKAMADYEENPQVSVEPNLPLFLVQEPTYEGTIKLLAESPSIGLFADEGGRFLGGHAMNKDNQLKTIAGFSELWNGKLVSRARGGDGYLVLDGVRFSIHLMLQPNIARQLLSNEGVSDQGFLSRCLAVSPETTCGYRPYKNINPYEDARLQNYFDRIRKIMEMEIPKDGETSEFTPRTLYLTPKAKKSWIVFHDRTEIEMRIGGDFEHLRAMANKLPEHVLRLAGILSLIDNPQTYAVEEDSILRGAKLALHYVSEAQRLFQTGTIDPRLDDAQETLDWLYRRGEDTITLVEVYQLGIPRIRDAKKARQIMHILEDHGWITPLPDGAFSGGKKRKEAWRIRKV